jgi:hypothetical protein
VAAAGARVGHWRPCRGLRRDRVRPDRHRRTLPGTGQVQAGGPRLHGRASLDGRAHHRGRHSQRDHFSDPDIDHDPDHLDVADRDVEHHHPRFDDHDSAVLGPVFPEPADLAGRIGLRVVIRYRHPGPIGIVLLVPGDTTPLPRHPRSYHLHQLHYLR